MWGGKGALKGGGSVRWCEMSREGGGTSEGSLESLGDGNQRCVGSEEKEGGSRAERRETTLSTCRQCGGEQRTTMAKFLVQHSSRNFVPDESSSPLHSGIHCCPHS